MLVLTFKTLGDFHVSRSNGSRHVLIGLFVCLQTQSCNKLQINARYRRHIWCGVSSGASIFGWVQHEFKIFHIVTLILTCLWGGQQRGKEWDLLKTLRTLCLEVMMQATCTLVLVTIGFGWAVRPSLAYWQNKTSHLAAEFLLFLWSICQQCKDCL